MPDGVAVRPFHNSDSLSVITELLHRAYAPLGAAGLNYTAVDQSMEVTKQRIARGICAVASCNSAVVGTIVVEGIKADGGTPWYCQPHVATAHQFAVEPSMQGMGVGSAIMSWAETWARAHGFRELAVDTAEPAQQLVAFYSRRGYRFVEFAQWSGKRYRTVILSKSLHGAP